MEPRDLPQISEAQVIAREAEKIFESLLSSQLWNEIRVPQERDFGIDYRVEAIADGQLQGCEFLVQLKGFRSLPASDPIPVTIATSTLRYWKNKILPILVVAVDCETRKAYFSWFDKAFEINPKQRTHTLHVSKRNELLDFRLQKSLAPYYEEWVTELHDETKRSFYKHLFSESLLMLDLLLDTIGSLLLGRHQSDEDRDAYRKARLERFITILSVYLHDLRLYKAGVDLTRNPIDQRLDTLLSQVSQLYDSFASQVGSQGAYGIVMVNPERAYECLPTLSFVFSEINQFFRTRLLS